MKANNKVETNRKIEEENKTSIEDVDDVCVKYPIEEEELVVRRTLNMHINMNDKKC